MSDSQEEMSKAFQAYARKYVEDHGEQYGRRYERFLLIMERMSDSSDGIFLSAEEVEVVEGVCYDTAHQMAHLVYGKCVGDDGLPIHVVVVPATDHDPRQN